jgi:SAM-dependent methyltransferase
MGLEPFEDAVRYVSERFAGKAEALLWKMPGPLPQRFDLITMIEVLEHLEDDVSAVRWLADHLEPGGHVLITTPAHQRLWTQIDEAVHHYRRYDRKMLLRLFNKEFEIIYFTYYNFFLFPLKLAFVLFDRIERALHRTAPEKSYHGIPPAPVNELCKRLNTLEAAVMKRKRSFPVGASIAMLARKRA